MKVADKLRETAGRLITGAIEDGSVEVGMLCEAADEIDRLHAVVRINGLRWGHSHAEIDDLLNQQKGKQNEF